MNRVSTYEIESVADDIFKAVDRLPVRAREFGNSVCQKTESIVSSVRNYDSGTENQLRALENMRSALRKWIKN